MKHGMGCLIFIIIVVFLPIIGWIASNIKWIIIGVLCIAVLIWCIKDDAKEVQQDERDV